jgi:hypothetical protein
LLLRCINVDSFCFAVSFEIVSPVEFLLFFISLLFFCHLLRENILTPFDLLLENFSLWPRLLLFFRCFICDCYLQVRFQFFFYQLKCFSLLRCLKERCTWGAPPLGRDPYLPLCLFIQVCFCSYLPAHLFGFHYWGAVIQFFSIP